MTTHQIFENAATPGRHRRNELARSVNWLTWSKAFRSLIGELLNMGAFGHRTILKNVRGCTPYSTTYHPSKENIPTHYQTAFLRFASNLHGWPVRSGLWLFRGMLDPPLEAGNIRALFALLRASLVTRARDSRAALYAPVSPERKDHGFKLHADLFLTTRLWLIFDDVPEDGTGASLFLSRGDLLSTLRTQKEIPTETVRKVFTLMTRPIARDSFDRLYGILHSERRRWSDSLYLALRDKTRAIPLYRGEGYLLDDRHWLHGRTPASQAVTAGRFHRLTFGLR
jgi:hypothetical protein